MNIVSRVKDSQYVILHIGRFIVVILFLKEKVRGDSMIRLVKETDAEAIMNIRKEIILSETTTKFFIVSPKKLPNDMNAEREKIRKSNEKGNLYIVYEVDGKVVGFLIFNRYELERLQHAGTMGMGIKEAYCNQGIGTKLIEFLISWAKRAERFRENLFRCSFC